MLFYLAAGMVLLFLKQPRLTFVCFAGCALLCFFLKFSLKSNTIERWRQAVIKNRLPAVQEAPEIQFRAVHLNVTNTADASDMLNTLRQCSPDLVSFHEVTPDWGRLLKDSLAALYPFHHDMVDIGLFGMAIFSRHPLTSMDTFYYEEIPNLRGCVDVEDEKLCFLSVHTEPALNSFSLLRLREHLGLVATEVRRMEVPVIVMGDFNSVSWSNEMQVFMDSSGLLESRTGFMPFSNGGTSSFFDIPLDHIFFSPRLYCNGFEVLKSKAAHRLGILGNYSFKPLATHAKKTAQ
jgi:endonuclease/exonuclease/phosphatase (EEP) superfamily protein YafD